MKILSGIIALLVLVPVLCFALSNRAAVDVQLWPFDGALSLPLYLVGLAPLAFGLAFGALWSWAHSVPHRLKSRRLHKEVGALTERIGTLQQAASFQPVPAIPSKRKFWERKS